MKKAERELLDRIAAYLDATKPMRTAFVQSLVKDGFRHVEADSWLECSELCQAVLDRLRDEVMNSVVSFHESPPTFSKPRKPVFRERDKVPG